MKNTDTENTEVQVSTWGVLYNPFTLQNQSNTCKILYFQTKSKQSLYFTEITQEKFTVFIVIYFIQFKFFYYLNIKYYISN